MFLWEHIDNSWYGIYGDNIIKFSASTSNSIALPEVIKITLFNSVAILRSKDGRDEFLDLTMT
jgi:hypothetical protein